MNTIKEAKKEFVKELKISARYSSSEIFVYKFDIKEYSDYEIVDAFSEYLDELGFEYFKVSASTENDKLIMCKIELKWEDEEKDGKFKLYNKVIEISRNYGIFFGNAVNKLIYADLDKRLDGWHFPIIYIYT